MDGQLTVYKQYFEEDFLKRTEEYVSPPLQNLLSHRVPDVHPTQLLRQRECHFPRGESSDRLHEEGLESIGAREPPSPSVSPREHTGLFGQEMRRRLD